MKVAVTGATGFVGKAVVEDLSRDMEVIALGRKGGSILQMQPLEQPLADLIPRTSLASDSVFRYTCRDDR